MCHAGVDDMTAHDKAEIMHNAIIPWMQLQQGRMVINLTYTWRAAAVGAIYHRTVFGLENVLGLGCKSRQASGS